VVVVCALFFSFLSLSLLHSLLLFYHSRVGVLD
jgi:hypothetical protein